MNSLDAYKEGRFDSNSPINQHEEETQIESITDAYEIGTAYDFYNRVLEARTRVNFLRDALRESHPHIKKQLTEIYNLI